MLRIQYLLWYPQKPKVNNEPMQYIYTHIQTYIHTQKHPHRSTCLYDVDQNSLEYNVAYQNEQLKNC